LDGPGFEFSRLIAGRCHRRGQLQAKVADVEQVGVGEDGGVSSTVRNWRTLPGQLKGAQAVESDIGQAVMAVMIGAELSRKYCTRTGCRRGGPRKAGTRWVTT